MLETVDFIVPSYWEVLDLLSGSGVKFVVYIIVSFWLGFLLERFFCWKLMKEMGTEIDEMRQRFVGAKNLVAARVMPVKEFPVSHQEASPESLSRLPIQDIDTRSVPHTERWMESTRVTQMHHNTKHRIVLITKVLGPNKLGIRPQTSLLGFEKAPPVVGKPYQVSLEVGPLLTTSVVHKISDEYIQTDNSLYKVQVQNEEGNN
jgi:hypothetical protein